MTYVVLALGHLWMLPLTLAGFVVVGIHSLFVGKHVRVSWTWRGIVFEYPGRLWGMDSLMGQCLGGVILVRSTGPISTARTLVHEGQHVFQQMVLGPFILLAYPVSSFAALVRGRHWYRDNVFEIDARREAGQ